jgi:uncharacterized protein
MRVMAKRDGYATGTPSWVDLTTPDIEGVKRFYNTVFGIGFEDLPETPASTYQLLKVDGDVVGGTFCLIRGATP